MVTQPHVLAFPLLERLQQRFEHDALEDSPDLAVARANRVDQRAAVAVIARVARTVQRLGVQAGVGRARPKHICDADMRVPGDPRRGGQ